MQPVSSHFRTPLEVRYPRPVMLSDSPDDFLDDFSRAVIAMPDAELAWREFRGILGPYHIAGTYEQSVYFLPIAFEHIISHNENALDLVSSIVWFVSEYADRLEADGLLNNCRERVSECFEIWTSRFEVIHFDQVACRAKGWGIVYCDYVKNQEVICQGTCDLFDFARHADLAESFFRRLANHGSDPVKAAWFLEMSLSQIDVYYPPEDAKIRKLLTDKHLIHSAASVVRSSLLAGERSATYWRDTLAAVGAM